MSACSVMRMELENSDTLSAMMSDDCVARVGYGRGVFPEERICVLGTSVVDPVSLSERPVLVSAAELTPSEVLLAVNPEVEDIGFSGVLVVSRGSRVEEILISSEAETVTCRDVAEDIPGSAGREGYDSCLGSLALNTFSGPVP